MPQPLVVQTISGYKFTFVDEKIEVLVSRLRNQHDGSLKGDLKFVLGSKKLEEPSFSFNFSSATTRKQLVKTLDEKYPAANKDKPQWEWTPIIDELTRRIQTIWRTGEPVVHILSTDDVDPLDYLIYPIIPKDNPTAIFGDPGAGKSKILSIFYVVAIIPLIENTLRLKTHETSSKILYLDYESNENDFRRLIKAIGNGLNIHPIPFEYRFCSIPLADDLDAVKEHAFSIGADTIFIDSMSLAAGGDLNRMDVATSYIRALRQLKMTTVSAAHTSKDIEAKHKTIIGSTLFTAGFRQVWECRGQEHDKDTLDIALLLRKTNVTGKLPPMGYRLVFDNAVDEKGKDYLESLFVSWHDPRSVPEFVERMGNNTRILDALKEGTKTAKELVEELEITYQACHIALKRLADKRLVMKLPDGKRWGLPVI